MRPRASESTLQLTISTNHIPQVALSGQSPSGSLLGNFSQRHVSFHDWRLLSVLLP